MKKTLAKRFLAVAMMACMILAMALPASAAYRYELELEITEANPSVKTSTSAASKITVKDSSGSVSESADLTAELVNLLVANFEGEAKTNKSGLWDFESDAMGITIAAGLKAYRTSPDAWEAWIDGFAAKSEITGDKGALVTLIKESKKVGDMEVNTPYELTYIPVGVADGDPAKNNIYTFTLTLNRNVIGGGSAPSGGITVIDPKPDTPDTPDTPADVVVDVPEATTPDEVVTLPVEEVKVGEDTQVTVNTKSETPVKVVIPVAETTSGTVAVLIKEDGTEQIIRDSVITEDGVMASVSDGDKIVIKDNTKTFNDVTDAHWGKDAVTFVAARGIFAGTGDGTTFSPDVTTNRGMVAQVLHNLEYNEAYSEEHNFHDVGDHHWYDNAVSWAAEKGVVGGYGDGSFQGDKNVSREELVVMLWNYAGKQASEDDSHVDAFNDAANVSDWAKAAMNWALENGILGGKGGKMLDPTGMATRAELAQMIKNFCANK